MTPPTNAELLDVMDTLPQECPMGWRNVSQTQLSLARHSGAVTVDGWRYVYFPADDSLWRADVCTAVKKLRKAETARGEATSQQLGLYG